MHPALRLSNLDRLPMSYRTVAAAACASDASEQDIQRFAGLLRSLGKDRLVNCLPVFFLVLDTARVPTAAQLDKDSPNTRPTVSVALLSLRAIFDLQIPPKIGVELWPRVLAWIDFIQMFREFLAALQLNIDSERALYADYLNFTRRVVSEHPPNAEILCNVPGFKITVVRAWACSLASPGTPPPLHEHLHAVQLLVHYPAAVDDMVEGAGSMDDLARLITLQLDLLLTDTPGLSKHRWALLAFLLETVVITGNPLRVPEEIGDSKPLWTALISRGFVKSLTAAACLLGELGGAVIPGAGDVIDRCMRILCAIFYTQEGYGGLCIAVQNGLLGAIVACGKSDVPHNGIQAMTALLTDVLAPATVYYYVLVDLASAYFAVGEPAGCPPQLTAAWTIFSQTMQRRLTVLRVFDSMEISHRACDNVQCGIIREKTSFKSCSGCRRFVYCSEACQSLDWRRGHREKCAEYRSSNPSIHLDYKSRERAFICALLHHDYESVRSEVLAKVSAIGPDALCYAEFDYRSSQVTITVDEFPPNVETEDDPLWADIVARASNSGGRMFVHFALLRIGINRCQWVIPLRAATGSLEAATNSVGHNAVHPAEIHQLLTVPMIPDMLRSRG
ncbi:hypothetical protein DFH07DRAFT_236440 [Mycena maculata]|uniref:MYND-type domain-containing protein n=1 Tax=Mycena maculata TaxID=230809 RepID=A0AAD7MP95_9AGAR|nr:hypothetical protein DFH07DRAFT_236440 [Mycena maculata]